MTLLQARGANAARSRTVPMFAALAPLLIFVGFDGVVHGVARSAFHQESGRIPEKGNGTSENAGFFVATCFSLHTGRTMRKSRLSREEVEIRDRWSPLSDAPVLYDSTSTATGPIFVSPVGNQTAAIGREVVFSCSVRNISIRKYKVGWLRNSDQTILSIHTRIVTHNARISVSYESGGSSGSGGASGGTFGVTGSSQATEEVVNGTWRLHIRQLKETDRGCYMCQINTSPMISELGCLDIHVPPDIVYGDTSADLAVAEGDNATLSCRATGHPPPRVSWRREDGEPIVIRAPTAGGSAFERHDHYNGSLLHFHRVERRQMGAYLCIASNDVPPAVSKRVTLAVNFAPVVKAPNQLLGSPLGTDVQLECYVEAFPNTINYWVKNQRGTEDEMLLEGPKYNVREERTGYTVLMWLLIKKFTEKDVGSYKCVSTNSLGKADGTLRLYEIKIGFERASRGKDHVSIIGGLAEAAQSSGASNGVEGFSGSGSSLSHILSMFFFIPILWPR
ncbi:lachesin-like isoform X1 [Formica exsecta]|uniref:lachesin-like isoform X1 n=1 Tax=Formica exsecta TaxID=72781 RepID=UPI001144ED6D|nr:lachesin-like isoform X1 [Formica exsecta]